MLTKNEATRFMGAGVASATPGSIQGEIAMATYLIVGNGMAGNSAAEAIRKYDKEGPVLIFAKERYPFYYIPGLPEYLSGERPLNRLIIHDEKWYGDNRL